MDSDLSASVPTELTSGGVRAQLRDLAHAARWAWDSWKRENNGTRALTPQEWREANRVTLPGGKRPTAPAHSQRT